MTDCAEPEEAFAAIEAGAAWFFHWCAGARTRPNDATSAEAMNVARLQCISLAERDRLAEKARRKGRTKTVVMAERWVHPAEGTLIVFIEDAPHAWPQREDPRHRP
jgi:hypothetical protein